MSRKQQGPAGGLGAMPRAELGSAGPALAPRGCRWPGGARLDLSPRWSPSKLGAAFGSLFFFLSPLPGRVAGSAACDFGEKPARVRNGPISPVRLLESPSFPKKPSTGVQGQGQGWGQQGALEQGVLEQGTPATQKGTLAAAKVPLRGHGATGMGGSGATRWCSCPATGHGMLLSPGQHPLLWVR